MAPDARTVGAGIAAVVIGALLAVAFSDAAGLDDGTDGGTSTRRPGKPCRNC